MAIIKESIGTLKKVFVILDDIGLSDLMLEEEKLKEKLTSVKIYEMIKSLLVRGKLDELYHAITGEEMHDDLTIKEVISVLVDFFPAIIKEVMTSSEIFQKMKSNI